MELKSHELIGTLLAASSLSYSLIVMPDVGTSLSSCGVDSIAFAQVKGRVLNDLGMEVPMVYLSDAFSISDMIQYIYEGILARNS
jgi:acyl carrier protein